MVLPFSTRLTM